MTSSHVPNIASIASLSIICHLVVITLVEQVLLLAATLNLVSNELLVILEVLLDMQLEADDVIKHALDLCVKLFSKRVGTKLKLLIPAAC
jgi:hypothetical protein